jgi:hypothetical protein
VRCVVRPVVTMQYSRRGWYFQAGWCHSASDCPRTSTVTFAAYLARWAAAGFRHIVLGLPAPYPRQRRTVGHRRARHHVGLVQAAVTAFPREIHQARGAGPSRPTPKLIYFNEVDSGGHVAAGQEPALFATEVRAAFRTLR